MLPIIRGLPVIPFVRRSVPPNGGNPIQSCLLGAVAFSCENHFAPPRHASPYPLNAVPSRCVSLNCRTDGWPRNVLSANEPISREDVTDTGWVTSAALGLTLTRGNSETLQATGNILSEKKWSQNELRLGLDAT